MPYLPPQHSRMKIAIPKLLLCGMVLGAVAVALYASYLSYAGYCFSEHRYLLDEEKIRRVLNEVIFPGYPPSILERETHPGVYTTFKPSRPIPYTDVNEFYKLNQDCCSVRTQFGNEIADYEPSFWERLTGKASSFVRINYLVRYLDGFNLQKSTSWEQTIPVSNCGTPNKSYWKKR
jgi:hypothetical protein